MKVMPGTEHEYVEAAYRLGTRLSMNIETPTAEMMQRISPHKDMEQDILAPMDWVDKLTRSDTGGAVGQVTQFVVGAADESNADIFRRVDQLYGDWNLKRVYYSAFRPARYTPLEEHPPTPMIREHRLYQMDWLKRVHHFSNDELTTAFNAQGFLLLDHDPKTVIALEKLDSFPMDINAASHEQLLRIPGVPHVGAAHCTDATPPQHRHLAGPPGHGCGEEAAVALPGLPRQQASHGQAAQVGAPWREIKPAGGSPACAGSQSGHGTLRPGDVLQRLRPVRRARPPGRCPAGRWRDGHVGGGLRGRHGGWCGNDGKGWRERRCAAHMVRQAHHGGKGPHLYGPAPAWRAPAELFRLFLAGSGPAASARARRTLE